MHDTSPTPVPHAGPRPLIPMAWIFSVLLHPLFIPLYVILYLLYIDPQAFTGFSDAARRQTWIIVLINLTLFPLLAVLLLRALKLIGSLQMKERKDRIIPYIASGIFFFWTYTVFKEQPQYPVVLRIFTFGLFLSSSAALLANIYFKISMHAIGSGLLVGLFLWLALLGGSPAAGPLSVALVLVGVTATSRLVLGAHDPADIYGGWLVGLCSIFAAAFFIS